MTFFVNAIFPFWPELAAAHCLVLNTKFLLDAMGGEIPGHVKNVGPLVFIIVVFSVMVSPTFLPCGFPVTRTSGLGLRQAVRARRPLDWGIKKRTSSRDCVVRLLTINISSINGGPQRVPVLYTLVSVLYYTSAVRIQGTARNKVNSN